MKHFQKYTSIHTVDFWSIVILLTADGRRDPYKSLSEFADGPK